jgi:hypothetical protein
MLPGRTGGTHEVVRARTSRPRRHESRIRLGRDLRDDGIAVGAQLRWPALYPMSQRLKSGLSWPGFSVCAGEPFGVGPEAARRTAAPVRVRRPSSTVFAAAEHVLKLRRRPRRELRRLPQRQPEAVAVPVLLLQRRPRRSCHVVSPAVLWPRVRRRPRRELRRQSCRLLIPRAVRRSAFGSQRLVPCRMRTASATNQSRFRMCGAPTPQAGSTADPQA